MSPLRKTGSGRVSICPRCKRPVEARDFMNPAVVGMLDSVLPRIECRCGYSGLPIELSLEDYRKLKKRKP